VLAANRLASAVFGQHFARQHAASAASVAVTPCRHTSSAIRNLPATFRRENAQQENILLGSARPLDNRGCNSLGWRFSTVRCSCVLGHQAVNAVEFPLVSRKQEWVKQCERYLVQSRLSFLELSCALADTRAADSSAGTKHGKDAITNSIGMKLVLVPSGQFLMGNSHTARDELKVFNSTNDAEPLWEALFADEYPQHRVRITKELYFGAYPVTRGQFRQFIAQTGFKTDAEREDPMHQEGAMDWGGPQADKYQLHADWSWRKTGFPQTDDHPVINVSWNDARAFCKWLSGKEGKVYRLPTEAEWEYACRAGTTTRYSFGDDPKRLTEFANVADATARKAIPAWTFATESSDGYVFTSPVGKFRPNPFGLYDMHGNVAQWCHDVFDDKYYSCSPLSDPTGPEPSDDDDCRSVRGGDWGSGPWLSRSSTRLAEDPDFRCSSLGFRVVRER